MMLKPIGFLKATAAPSLDVSYITSLESSPGSNSGLNNTARTFSGVSFGTAAADRDMYVGVGAVFGDLVNATMTIGGVSATQLVEERVASEAGAAIYKASVPTGATGDIVFTPGAGGPASVRDVGIGVFRATGVTADGSTSQDAQAGGSLTLDLNVSAGSAVIAICANGNGGGWTFTNGTEVFDFDIRSTENFAGALDTGVGAATPRSLSASCTQNAVGVAVEIQ